jgi:preprotein translocase subunit SecD
MTAAARDGQALAYLVGPAALDDAQIDRCSVEVQSQPWGVQVRMHLTPEGAARLADLTRAQLHRRVVIALDGEVETAPVVMEPITGGEVAISTGADPQAARDLTAILRHGPLPDGLRLEAR